MTGRVWLAAIVGAALALGLGGVAAASAQPLAPPIASATPTPTSTPDPDPYAERVHAPGDADSDPTWVWVAAPTTADDVVTLVEFLDFECEACGAYYPYMEQFREDYAGQVTFAFRYFPLPGHGNSVNAAVAVEAAAQQDQLEPMFHRMFQSQPEWGEKGAESQAPLFRTYAEELGLDMEQYDADVADPATLQRIELDFNEGIALGVEATPTFFLNGERLGTPAPDELRTLIDAALDE